MNPNNLSRFDLNFPGNWIAGDDRDLAFETFQLLKIVKDQLLRAVVSCSLFQPISEKNIRKRLDEHLSEYEACLNSIYATTFVLSLDTIAKLLHTLRRNLEPPTQARDFVDRYQEQFGQLKYIRDSIMHIEDRGRGKDRNQENIPASFFVLGVYVENRYEFTGEDGNRYSVEISENTLLAARKIIQDIINAYKWE